MGQVDDEPDDEVVEPWRAVPRIVFVESCTLQWLHDYGGLGLTRIAKRPHRGR
jgi:hypothetical protein